MPCGVDRHPLHDRIDGLLQDGQMPAAVARWIGTQTPTQLISKDTVNRHRRICLNMPPLTHAQIVAAGGAAKHGNDAIVEPQQRPEDLPSAKLGRDVTDDDIEQRMKKRFYDTIDQMSPDKVAEWLIEREKSKNRQAPKPKGGPTEEEVPADIAELRAAAARALGPKASRTRARAV